MTDDKMKDVRARQQAARNNAVDVINKLADLGIGAILITMGPPSLDVPADQQSQIQILVERNKLMGSGEMKLCLQQAVERFS